MDFCTNSGIGLRIYASILHMVVSTFKKLTSHDPSKIESLRKAFNKFG